MTTEPGMVVAVGLLDDAAPAASLVVAYNAINRERVLDGVNSYARELGFHQPAVASRHERT